MIIGTMQDLSHVEENFEKKFNKINTKSFREIGGSFCYCWKTSMS